MVEKFVLLVITKSLDHSHMILYKAFYMIEFNSY
jgi:hypothetical protein